MVGTLQCRISGKVVSVNWQSTGSQKSYDWRRVETSALMMSAKITCPLGLKRCGRKIPIVKPKSQESSQVMPLGYNQTIGGQSGGPFDSRAAEAAFSSASNGPSTSGAPNGSAYGGPYGAMDGSSDPFAFLSSGLGSLTMNDDGARRNGANNTKSPV